MAPFSYSWSCSCPLPLKKKKALPTSFASYPLSLSLDWTTFNLNNDILLTGTTSDSSWVTYNPSFLWVFPPSLLAFYFCLLDYKLWFVWWNPCQWMDGCKMAAHLSSAALFCKNSSSLTFLTLNLFFTSLVTSSSGSSHPLGVISATATLLVIYYQFCLKERARITMMWCSCVWYRGHANKCS